MSTSSPSHHRSSSSSSNSNSNNRRQHKHHGSKQKGRRRATKLQTSGSTSADQHEQITIESVDELLTNKSAATRRVDGQIVTLVGFQGARHLVSARLPLPGCTSKDSIVGVRLPDLTKDTSERVRQLRQTLRRIDLSSLGLIRLPEGLISDMPNLQHLDISRNQLTELSFPTDSPCLVGLLQLHAYNNRLQRAIVPDIARQLAQSLRRLNLAENCLTDWEAIGQLTNLQVLILDDNHLDSISDDTLQNLKRLEVFHCARNSISNLPSTIKHLRCLRDINLSGNDLTTLTAELLLLPKLEVLNLSCNAIRCVPTVRLYTSRRTAPPVPTISRSNINTPSPQPIITSQTTSRLTSVDLSDNCIVRFPQQLFTVVQRRLDVSRNQIQNIPLGLERTLRQSVHGSTLQQQQRPWVGGASGCTGSTASAAAVLCLDDNPLVCPPEDVCRCGTRAIANYLAEAKTYLPTYQGIKMLVIGCSGAGKTSMIQTLLDEQSRLTGEDRTIFMDTFDWTIDVSNSNRTSDIQKKSDVDGPAKEQQTNHVAAAVATYQRQLQVSVWDFSGNDRYSTVLWKFVEHPTLILVTFSLADYDETRFGERIGRWLEWLMSKAAGGGGGRGGGKIVCLPVATHSDCIAVEQLENLLKSVSQHIQRFLSDRLAFLDSVIQSIESLPHVDTAKSDQLKRCLILKKLDIHVCRQVIAVDSVNNVGFQELANTVRTVGCDPALFPLSMRSVPGLWDDVERFLETYGESLPVPIVSWPEYEKLVVDRFGLKRALCDITQYLHDTAKVWWCSADQSSPLSKHVVLRPLWLIDVLRLLFRHDLPTNPTTPSTVQSNFPSAAPYYEELATSCRHTGVSWTRFDRLRAEFVRSGIVDIDYLRVVWHHQVVDQTFSSENQLDWAGSLKTFSDLFDKLVAGLELGYRVPRSFARDGSNVRPKVTRRPVTAVGGATAGPVVATPGAGAGGGSVSGGAGGGVALQGSGKVMRQQSAAAERIRFVVCPLRKVGRPRMFQEEYESFLSLPGLVAVYQFPRYLPPAFFDLLIVRLVTQSSASPTTVTGKGRRRMKTTFYQQQADELSLPPFQLSTIYHWQYGFYAYDCQLPVRVLIQHGRSIDAISFLRIETRLDNSNAILADKHDTSAESDSSADEQPAPTNELWRIMLPLLHEADRVLSGFAGVYVDRRMECPLCHTPSFDGLWSTPKQLQTVTLVTCLACQQQVCTNYLVQPQQKYSVEQFLQKLEQQQQQQVAVDVQELQQEQNLVSDLINSERDDGNIVSQTATKLLTDSVSEI